MKKAWIIVNQELCGEIVPSWWETDENNFSTPVTYETEREAYVSIAEVQKERIRLFLKDKKASSFDTGDDQVISCEVADNGVITAGDLGELFSPFEPQSKYGR